jgi:hypothetical protein
LLNLLDATCPTPPVRPSNCAKSGTFTCFMVSAAGAAEVNRRAARVGNMEATFRCIGGVDVSPAAIRDFEKLAGRAGHRADPFDAERYAAFHGCAPPASWRARRPQHLGLVTTLAQ